MSTRRPMPIPCHPRVLITALLVCVAALPVAEAQRSEAYSQYDQYLNYHRARIDGETHPDDSQRKAAAARAAQLAPAAEKLDIDSIRKNINGNASDRQLTFTKLTRWTELFPRPLAKAEAQLVAAVKRRDDPDVAPEDKPDPAVIERLEKKIAWTQARLEFFQNEIAAFTGEPSEAQEAFELYEAFIRLEEARAVAATTKGAEAKRVAEASVELQEQRLRGSSLEAARAALPKRQLAKAMRQQTADLKEIPRRIRALANKSPEETQRLLKMQEFYEAETKALREAYEKSAGRK